MEPLMNAYSGSIIDLNATLYTQFSQEKIP